MGKIKKITIHAGHNPKGKIACGASDYLDESSEARKLVKLVIKELKKLGVKSVNCTVNNGTSQIDVLQKICWKCNNENRDLDVSIHFNAASHESKSNGKTLGTEVLVRSKEGVRGEIAQRICNHISSVGFTNRGVKVDTGLYFLNHTDKPALLIEVCFVTDKDDAVLYKNNRPLVAKKIARAIAK